MPEKNQREMRRLLQEMLDGRLSDEQFAALTRRLHEDEEARRLLAQQMSVHSQLERIYGGRLPSCPATRPATRLEKPRPSARRRIVDSFQAAYRFVRRYPVLSCTTAALVIALLVGTLAFLPADPQRADDLNLNRAPELVAVLKRTNGAKWAPGQTATHHGANLTVGHRMQLTAGRAEIIFNCGVRAVLQGPAELVIDSAGGAALRRGTLSARVPPQAKGFLVKTPGSEIVDLGTEFVAAVSPAEETDVHVFVGLVELQLVAGDMSDGELVDGQRKLRISAGQSGRVARRGDRFEMLSEPLSDERIAALHAVGEALPEPQRVQLPAVKDTFVIQGEPKGAHGGETQLLVKAHDAKYAQGNWQRETWIAFDVSKLPRDRIVHARLRLTGLPFSKMRSQRRFRLNLFAAEDGPDDLWREASFAWRDRASVRRNWLQEFYIDGVLERGQRIDLTSGGLVQALKDDANGVLTLIATRDTIDHNIVHGFASRENAELPGPTLEVWCEPPPTDQKIGDDPPQG